MSGSWLLKVFPNLNNNNFKVTSPATNRYNCIAWAAGSTTQWWWPFEGLDQRESDTYWPAEVPKEETVSAFEMAFKSLGYERCQNGTLEEDYEKIVLYVMCDNELVIPTHAAKQLECGSWTSKLGESVDIVHNEVEDLVCPTYGEPHLFMKRPSVDKRNSTV